MTIIMHMSEHIAGYGGWRIYGLAAVTAALTAAAAAGLYLWLLWLPNADPRVITWPDGLALLAAPSAVGLGLRRAPSGLRFAAFVVCLLASVALTIVGAVLLFVAGSR